MSAIATFYLVSITDLSKVRDAAIPRNPLLGSTDDRFHEILGEVAEEFTTYEFSGYMLATAIPYLDEILDVDLRAPEMDELIQYLCEARGSSWVSVTSEHKARYLESLKNAEIKEEDLVRYYEDFTESNEPEVGLPMKRAIDSIISSLEKVDEETVVLIEIT